MICVFPTTKLPHPCGSYACRKRLTPFPTGDGGLLQRSRQPPAADGSHVCRPSSVFSGAHVARENELHVFSRRARRELYEVFSLPTKSCRIPAAAFFLSLTDFPPPIVFLVERPAARGRKGSEPMSPTLDRQEAERLAETYADLILRLGLHLPQPHPGRPGHLPDGLPQAAGKGPGLRLPPPMRRPGSSAPPPTPARTC